ncbi:glutamyl-tRNA synthetase [Rhodothalassium salexigens DSM 2132]|uniref:Glutamate--tRNA ligase n=1 Tax=Rhodothalassium salexigens DSM 2132 TaxID=1188247 RepID=A0A4R2PUP9_RHOSA|nr:glutamate--tRNA ligase [Rhodothalassium salexigens]MBB4210568.1 glutamyl-tRNA synthetase [Rhodothalassium salexigens DSM 2132]MBK1639986.1 glutamate--tRNA ligase [Rhodothalassium salexigens DSM 2132]TCP37875.1 glutamyl-tRNA synthetase [Rhodothalassium salexigens DSM 2132]
MTSIRARFAPSPTGYLHVGNARAAVLNWLFCRQAGGDFILRIDDTDLERSKPEYTAAIERDLTWLGIDWGRQEYQSQRFDRYGEAVERLKAAGRLYPCYETGEELEVKRKIQRAQGKPPVYDRAALALSADDIARLEAEGRRPHWRFKLDRSQPVRFDDLIRGPQEIDPNSVSDPILIRADGSYLYTLPSVVDDIEFAITHIMRGEDHVTNSGVQVQIFEALGAQAPAFAHFSLLTAKEGQAFSKRAGGTGSLAGLRDAGIEPMALMSFLARLGSADPIEPFIDPDELARTFDFARFGKAPAKVDLDELDTLNHKVVRRLPFAAVRHRPELAGVDAELFAAAQPNLDTLADLAEWRAIVDGPVTPEIAPEDADYLAEAAGMLPPAPLDGDSWGAWTKALKDASGRKGKQLFMPLRKALTGQGHGPDMGALLPLIGRDKALARLAGETA